MKCSKCGNEIQNGFQVCSACGNIVSNTEVVEVKTVVKKKKSPVKFIVGAVVLAAAAAGGFVLFTALQNPLFRFSKSVVNLGEDLSEIKNASYEIVYKDRYEDLKISGKIDIDGSQKIALIGADLKIDGEKGNAVIYVTDEKMVVGVRDPDGEINTVEDDSKNVRSGLDLIWNYYNNKNYSIRDYIEENEMTEEVEEVVELDNIEVIKKNFISNVKSSKTRKELAEILDIQKESSTYSCSITGEKITETAGLLLDALTDASEDLAEPEFIEEFEEIYDTLNDELDDYYYYNDAEEDDKLGKISWTYSGLKLSELSLSYDEEDVKINVKFEYTVLGNLKSITFDYKQNNDRIKFSMTDINSTKGTIDSIPDKLYEETVYGEHNQARINTANANAKQVFVNAQTEAQDYEVSGKTLKNGVYSSDDNSDFSKNVGEWLGYDRSEKWSVYIEDYIVYTAVYSENGDVSGCYPYQVPSSENLKVAFRNIDIKKLSKLDHGESNEYFRKIAD